MSCKIGSQCYIDSKGIDLENKIVPVILSDESKVLRFSWEDGMYDLILEHTEKAVDLKRKDILPVLLQHDTEMLPLGIWQNIRIEDKKLKGDAKFDSEDVVRLRGQSIITSVENGKEKINVDTGMLQKLSIVLGVKTCPWFSDMVDERYGVTQEIFNRRMGLEFRRIPTDVMDKLFKDSQSFNKADFNIKDLKKK